SAVGGEGPGGHDVDDPGEQRQRVRARGVGRLGGELDEGTGRGGEREEAVDEHQDPAQATPGRRDVLAHADHSWCSRRNSTGTTTTATSSTPVPARLRSPTD